MIGPVRREIFCIFVGFLDTGEKGREGKGGKEHQQTKVARKDLADGR